MFTSYNKKKKWKVLDLTPLLLFIFAANIKVVSSQIWDGVTLKQSDFLALQAFKLELKDPKGFLKSWNSSGIGVCSGWIGIKCAQGQVIVIQLPWKGLGGQISERISQLQGLRKLSLHDNLIGGSIPKALGFLPNLRGVQLFNNRLSGSMPPSLASFDTIRTIDFSNNSLSGLIPEGFFNSTVLIRLNLSFNSLSGPLPGSIFRSSSIVFLDLGHNNLSGSIPTSVSDSSKIQNLNLGHNFINGSIPTGLSNLSSLVVLNIENNKLDNKMPGDLARMNNLTQLDLSGNKLSGEIPESFANLQKLVAFNVSHNNLSGSVPLYLSRKFNSSSFVGNLQLCGYRGGNPCPSEAPSQIVPSSSPEEPIEKHHRRLSTKDIILIAAGILLILLLIVCVVLICCLLRKKAAAKGTNGRVTTREKGATAGARETEAGGDNGGKLVHFDGPVVFTTDDLLCATAEIMGKSSYGTVYKATLEDGNQVAVKRLREKITKSQKEFENEVDSLGKIRHPNLLPLRAYYLGPKGEKLLVFDYMPKGSLAAFLHARGPETTIDWPTRMRIAQGITKGLLYLHNEANIIHGNLTSSNILLDENMNAKIADYGISRLMTAAASASATALAGAAGYRAPELSKIKKPNTKVDVYSLGVLILELLTGKSPNEEVDGVDLPHWVASIVKEEWTNEVFDVELMRDTSTIGDELLNTLKLALHCVDPSPSARPEVQEVLQQLEQIRPPDTTTEAVSSKAPGDDDGTKEGLP